MKILYGVVGEGMGHAIRSGVVIDKLVEWGHEVEIAVSGRAHRYLADRFEGVSKIWGLSLVMEANEVKKLDTAKALLEGAASGWPENIRRYIEMTRRFDPDAVVTDFETWAALYGHNNRLPVISLDNIQAVRRLWHPPEILRGYKAEWRLTKSIIKAKIPTAYHYLITSFFDAPVKKDRTTLVPPILRPRIIEAAPDTGEHILVYQSSESARHLSEVLRMFDDELFRVYGLRPDIESPVREDNLLFCPFSEEQFVRDLATSKGVIASAGFTLISEALHLKKPYLATPVLGQFEQIMNARYIEHLGYGLQDESLDEFSIRAFLNHLEAFRENLADYDRQDNSRLFDALEGLLDQIAADL